MSSCESDAHMQVVVSVSEGDANCLHSVNSAARYMDAAASGGQTVMEEKLAIAGGQLGHDLSSVPSPGQTLWA